MTTLSVCVTGVSGCAAVVPRLLLVSTSDSDRVKGGCMQGLVGEFNSKCLQFTEKFKGGFCRVMAYLGVYSRKFTWNGWLDECS